MVQRSRSMKNERSDLNRLLGGLLLFCVVSAFFCVQNENTSSDDTSNTTIDAVQAQAQPSKASEFSSQELIKNMTALIESRNVQAMAALLADVSAVQAYEVIKLIINDPTVGLTPQEKLLLVLAVAKNYMNDSAAHPRLFNVFVEDSELFKDFSLIYFAAAHGYSDLIPLLEKWAQDKKATVQGLPELIANAVYQGMRAAIENNNVGALKNIVEQKVAVSPENLTELLWFAVAQAKDPAFVQLLIDHGANAQSVKDGYSLLAKAVTTKNLNLVKAVAEANPKPDVNAMHDSAVGTALQFAIQNSLIDIDEYLRGQGARE